MPCYEHLCQFCKHEWEDTYSIHAEVPKICPECKTEGQVKRLISGGGSVKVELTGKELIQQLWKEGKQIAKEARKNENLAASLYGRK
jgi:putative FmdB family regulatory protein